MTRPVIVNHGGRRDGYQVAVAFAKAGLLKSLVTDMYFDLNLPVLKSLKKFDTLKKRFHDDIPAGKVKTPLTAIFSAGYNQYFKKPDLVSVKDRALATSAFTAAIKHNANFFLYSYTAYEAFVKAKELNLPNQRFLFQMHPAPGYIRQILLNELERYPFAEASVKFESEMRDNGPIQRLTAEPDLADYIFVASSFTKQSLISTGVMENKIVVVPYGVNPLHFPFEPTKASGKIFKLLYVGQLVQRKGIADLFTALKRLNSHAISLTICTRGFFDEALLNAFKGLQIEIKRDVSHDDLLKEFHAADLFIFPSLAEGFGFVILEAMHTGLPVMTTSNTAGQDLIEDGINGFIVPPASPEKLAGRIEHAVLNRDQLKQMGEKAHHSAAQYTWDRFRNNIISNYIERSN